MSNLQSGADKAQMIELLNSIKIPVLGAGGGFAPIGKEGYQDGQTAPQGWLICDGSTHNIADYPELAAYIASHHGSTNYYGGDGVTTFAVPTRSGMPTSGVNTSDEHIVGEWRETQDGVLKKKPVYEKTVDFGQLPNNTEKTVAHNISNIDFMVGSSGVAYNSTKTLFLHIPCSVPNTQFIGYGTEMSQSKTNISITTGIDRSGFHAYVILQYTKTTDEWQTVQEGHSADGNGVFCIKATDSDNLNPDDEIIFDETGTERKIGYYKYANGTKKPVYEKSIYGTKTTTKDQDAIFSGAVPNYDTIIDYKVGSKYNNECEWEPNPCYVASNGDVYVKHTWSSASVSVDWYITFRYTKTTDTPS